MTGLERRYSGLPAASRHARRQGPSQHTGKRAHAGLLEDAWYLLFFSDPEVQGLLIPFLFVGCSALFYPTYPETSRFGRAFFSNLVIRHIQTQQNLRTLRVGFCETVTCVGTPLEPP